MWKIRSSKNETKRKRKRNNRVPQLRDFFITLKQKWLSQLISCGGSWPFLPSHFHLISSQHYFSAGPIPESSGGKWVKSEGLLHGQTYAWRRTPERREGQCTVVCRLVPSEMETANSVFFANIPVARGNNIDPKTVPGLLRPPMDSASAFYLYCYLLIITVNSTKWEFSKGKTAINWNVLKCRQSKMKSD